MRENTRIVQMVPAAPGTRVAYVADENCDLDDPAFIARQEVVVAWALVEDCDERDPDYPWQGFRPVTIWDNGFVHTDEMRCARYLQPGDPDVSSEDLAEMRQRVEEANNRRLARLQAKRYATLADLEAWYGCPVPANAKPLLELASATVARHLRIRVATDEHGAPTEHQDTLRDATCAQLEWMSATDAAESECLAPRADRILTQAGLRS